MSKQIRTPLTEEQVKTLKAGDEVFLSGVIFTARDQAHKRMAGNKAPFDIRGQIIYYCGPTGTPKHAVIGACGPTTSSRMDGFTPALLKAGLKGMIGKGNRSKEVAEAIKKHKAVYFLAPAGCGAYVAKFVRSAKLAHYRNLGPEAIYRLEVEGLPLIVGIDSKGVNIYDKKRWQRF